MRNLTGLIVGMAVLACGFALAQAPLDAERQAIERIRPEAEAILASLYNPEDLPDSEHLFEQVTDRLIALGPAVGAFMAQELDQPSSSTFNVAAYVMGHSGAADAVELLRRALERAESRGGKFGRACKTWAIYGLAIAGDEQAVARLDGGLDVRGTELMDGVSLLELAAMLTAPRSLPILLDQLERHAADEEGARTVTLILEALARLGDPRSKRSVAALLEHASPRVKIAAAEALASLRDPALFRTLDAALQREQEEPHVRRRIAEAMRMLGLRGKGKTILARLETEPHPAARRALFRLLGAADPVLAVKTFAAYWRKEDATNRVTIVRVLTEIDDPRTMNLLRSATRDRDNRVALGAVIGLAELATGAARETLLALLRDPRWPVVQTTIEELTRIGERRAAPRIAELLLRGELSALVTQTDQRGRIEKMGRALVDLNYAEPVEDLRRALTSQTDPQVTEMLRRFVALLEQLARRGDDPAKWIAALDSPDEGLRHLAYRRLGELGAVESVEALLRAFDGAAAAERVAILNALTAIGSERARPLLERVLLEPEFDLPDLRDVRSAAAWAARRMGGEAQADLLRRSAARREGRDVDVLVYYAMLDPQTAATAIRELWVPRLRYLTWLRGIEQERLGWLLHRIESGGSRSSLDQPPGRIELGH